VEFSPFRDELHLDEKTNIKKRKKAPPQFICAEKKMWRIRDAVNRAAELNRAYESPSDKQLRLRVMDRIKYSCYHEYFVQARKYETYLKDRNVRVTIEVKNGGKVTVEFFHDEHESSSVGRFTLGFFLLAEDFWYAVSFRSDEGHELEVERNFSLHTYINGQFVKMTKERKNLIYQGFRDEVREAAITLDLDHLWCVLERCKGPNGECPAWLTSLLNDNKRAAKLLSTAAALECIARMLPLSDILSLRLVCKATVRVLGFKILVPRVLSALGRFFGSGLQDFLIALRVDGGLVSGSFLLAALQSDFQARDLDLYLPLSYSSFASSSLTAWLSEFPQVEQYHIGESEDPPYSHLPFSVVRFWDRALERVIDVMFLKDGYQSLRPETWLRSWPDMDFLKNTFDGQKLVLWNNLTSLQTKSAPLRQFPSIAQQTTEQFKMINWNRICKYLARGFSLTNLRFDLVSNRSRAKLMVVVDDQPKFQVFDLGAVADIMSMSVKQVLLKRQAPYGSKVLLEQLTDRRVLEEAFLVQFYHTSAEEPELFQAWVHEHQCFVNAL
jgi:hypothetical protein